MNDHHTGTVSNTGDTGTEGSYTHIGSLQAEIAAKPGITCDDFTLNTASGEISTWSSDSKLSICSYEVEPHDAEECTKSEIFERHPECIEIKPDPGFVYSVITSENDQNAYENVEVGAIKSTNEDQKGVFLEEQLCARHNNCDTDLKSMELFHLEVKKENVKLECPELLRLEVKTEKSVEVPKIECVENSREIPSLDCDLTSVKEETMVECRDDDIKLERATSCEEDGDFELKLTTCTPDRVHLNKRIKFEPDSNGMLVISPVLQSDSCSRDYSYSEEIALSNQQIESQSVIIVGNRNLDNDYSAYDVILPLAENQTDAHQSINQSNNIVNAVLQDDYHKCPLCPKTFTTALGRLRHASTEHNFNFATSKENVTSIGTGNLSDADRSTDTKNNPALVDKLHKCPLCPQMLTSVDGHIHMSRVHKAEFVPATKTNVKEDNTLRCVVCLMQFPIKAGEPLEKSIESHLKTHISDVYTCWICKQAFTKNENLKSHLGFHKGRNIHFCHVCGMTLGKGDLSEGLIMNIKLHMALHRIGGQLTHSVPSFLADHVKMHRESAKPFVCNICGNQYVELNELLVHLATHYDGNRCRTSCSICHKEYGVRTVHPNLLICKSHQDICSLCPGGARNIEMENYFSHIESHYGKFYSCEICLQGFTQEKNREKHMLQHHSKPVHCCHVCGKITATCNILSHMEEHKSDFSDQLPEHFLEQIKLGVPKGFVCNLCGYTSNKHDKVQHLISHLLKHGSSIMFAKFVARSLYV